MGATPKGKSPLPGTQTLFPRALHLPNRHSEPIKHCNTLYPTPQNSWVRQLTLTYAKLASHKFQEFTDQHTLTPKVSFTLFLTYKHTTSILHQSTIQTTNFEHKN